MQVRQQSDALTLREEKVENRGDLKADSISDSGYFGWYLQSFYSWLFGKNQLPWRKDFATASFSPKPVFLN